MIIDKFLTPWDNTALTDTASSDAVDLTVTGDLSRSARPMRAVVRVGTAFTASGSATGTFALVQSDNADLSSPDTLYTTSAIAKATLVAGYGIMDIVLPRTSKRYLGFKFTVATGPMTAGTVTGTFVQDTETPIADRLVGNTGM
jgi:hypothetical protein